VKRLIKVYGLLLLFPLILGGESLRIATYNLRNYLSTDRWVDGVWRQDYPKPEREKKALRAIILEARPQILLLQEVGSVSHLRELQSDLRIEGIDYPYRYHLMALDQKRQVAALSQIAAKEVIKHTDLWFSYQGERRTPLRGLLELIFELNDKSHLAVFNLHLKSRWTVDEADPEAAKLRTAEAQAARDRIQRQVASGGRMAYVLGGDFNDHPSSASFRRFLHKGSQQLGQVITAVDQRQERWTYFYEKEVSYQMVDALIVSPNLLSQVVDGVGHIADHSQAMLASDHRMVYADFVFDR
jgi:endonuclease/exonuclease/phosphatase family metal-dependent hydrolase